MYLLATRSVLRTRSGESSRRIVAIYLETYGDTNGRLSGPAKKAKPRPFELGAVAGRTIGFSNVPSLRAKAALRAIRFTEVAGVPPAVFGQLQYGVGNSLLGAAGEALRPYVPEWTIWLAARCSTGRSDEKAAQVFSRSRMAFLGQDLVRELASAQRALIVRALERIPPKRGGLGAEFWRVRLGAGMEILSRCVVRLAADEVEDVLELAKRLYSDDRVTAHLVFWEPLRSLLRRSWEALPGPAQAQYALSLLSLPIVGLDGFSVDRPVVNFREPAWLMDKGPSRRRCPPPERSAKTEEQWRAVVDIVARGLSRGGEARKRAMARLATLAAWGRLTSREEQRLASSLWGSDWQQNSDLPKEAGVHPWVFVVLPQPRAGLALDRLRAPWSRPVDWRDESNELLEEFLSQVGGALGGLKGREFDIVLTVEEEDVLRAAVERWAQTGPVPTSPWSAQDIEPRWKAVRAVAKLLLRLRVSEAAASSLGRTLRSLRHDEVPAYELVPGVLNSAPAQLEDLGWALRLDSRARNQSNL